jgi:hypothetical protein
MADALLTENVLLPDPMVINLGPDCIWEGEFTFSPIKQSLKMTLDGHTILEHLAPPVVDSGRLIHLTGMWYNRPTVDQLIFSATRFTQMLMELTICDGRTFDVVWDLDKQGAQISPILERPDYINQVSPDWYIADLYFLIPQEVG